MTCLPNAVGQGPPTPRVLHLFEAYHRAANEIVLVTDPDATIVYASPAVAGLVGQDVERLLTCSVYDLLHPEEAEQARQHVTSVLRTGASRTATARLRECGSAPAFVEYSVANQLDATVGGLIWTLRDVTEQHVAQVALRASEARYRAIADTAEEGIWAIGLDLQTLYMNARMGQIIGLAPGEPCDFESLSQLDPRAAAELRVRLASRTERGPERYELRYAHPDGRERHLWISAAVLRADDGSVEGSLAMVSDITEVREAEHELRQAALRDSLTQLPNRTLLSDRLAHALARPASDTSVLFIDLDQFRLLNDSLGHDIGDQLLVAVAGRVRAHVRPHDTVARFGGDEFVVICEDTDAREAQALADELLNEIARPYDIDGEQVHAAASIGVATAASGAASAHDLLRYADTAVHAAKAAGRGRVCTFDPALAATVEDQYALAADLRAALAGDEIALHYQPIIDLATGAVVGIEALARWTHPQRGPVSPVTFVAIAELAGLAPQLDRLVLRRALSDFSRFREAGSVPHDAYVAVNLSARNLGDVSLDAHVHHWARQAGVPPEQICLEITETAIMADPHIAVPLLERLRGQGFRVAVDDFGTGYSSLAYLRLLPVSTLKIDRSFVADMISSRDAVAIVGSIIDLGRAVGVTVVAEGVETAEQAELLRTLGCQSGQGWWWGQAVAPEDIDVQRWTEPRPAAALRSGRRRARDEVSNEHGLHLLIELRAAGASPQTIAAALNAEGFRTPTGSRWHSTSVGRVTTPSAG